MITKEERNRQIVEMYASAQVLCIAIAKQFKVTPRTVQRLAKDAGCARTREESNRLMVPLKKFDGGKVSPKVKRLRAFLPEELRLLKLRIHPNCVYCNITRGHGTILEVDFINGNTANTDFKNLKTVCRKCLLKKNNVVY